MCRLSFFCKYNIYIIPVGRMIKKVVLKSAISRHGKVRVNSTLLIWLNEIVAKTLLPVNPYKRENKNFLADIFYKALESFHCLPESFCYKLCNTYSKVLNIYSKVSNTCYKLCNKNFLIGEEILSSRKKKIAPRK